jgi:hypothetical protein
LKEERTIAMFTATSENGPKADMLHVRRRELACFWPEWLVLKITGPVFEFQLTELTISNC